MIESVFKAYDIRATYPDPLNEDVAWRVGFATARFLLERAKADGHDHPMMRHIVVGRDMRTHSPSLAASLKQGMRDYGAHVVDIGMVDTPMTYFAVNHIGCAGAVQVTASHNPSRYNGFKISRVHAKPVGMGSGLERIKEWAVAAQRPAAAPAGGREESRDLWREYRDHLLRLMEPSLLEGSRTLRIAVDSSNGMAGTAVPKIFGDVPGLAIERINFDNSTGEFVHEPNPLVEANLAQVRDAVRRGKADFGVCFDGDADRCVIVDERGEPVGCDLILAMLVGDALKSNPGAAVVYDLRSSRSVAEAIQEAGGVPIESRVGHVFMKAKVAETGAPIGGELSGHFYFADMFNADSGVRAFVSVASAIASRAPGTTLSSMVAPFRRYSQSGEINFECADKAGAIAALKAAYPKARVTELDGVSLDAGEWWCNVRMSNTEPLLRLNLEARDAVTVERQVKALEPILGHRVAH